ncbi:RapZ C-terminal domain-containing protein, partial [Idiomarina abyssalis]
GGQHRSVYISQQLAERFEQKDLKVQVRHRELKQNG